MITLDQLFASISMTDLPAATRSAIATVIAALFAAWRIFLSILLEESRLVHGDRQIDRNPRQTTINW